jgi:two-component system, chemotaxis family, protein-glutamate methylesterase/glutaminase
MKDARKIAVLVVDDSFFIRKLIREMIESDEEIEVVGEAKDGKEAVEMADELRPDVITMDFQMPVMDGADATKEIMDRISPPPSIIIVSSHTKEGVEQTMESLRLGAIDFIGKPSGDSPVGIDQIQKELIEKIKVSKKARVQRVEKTVRTKERASKEQGRFKAIVIGASTGGPPVVERILSGIPPYLQSCILIIQHMPENFSRAFVETLNNYSKMEVREARDGDPVRSGVIYVIPSGWHGKVEEFAEKEYTKHMIHLNKEKKESGYRPSIDVLMRSVAEHFGSHSMGILLTGMGSDGKEGMRAIKRAGGHTIVQSPETAVIDSMPNSVIGIEAADEVLSPDDIVKKIISLSC